MKDLCGKLRVEASYCYGLLLLFKKIKEVNLTVVEEICSINSSGKRTGSKIGSRRILQRIDLRPNMSEVSTKICRANPNSIQRRIATFLKS